MSTVRLRSKEKGVTMLRLTSSSCRFIISEPDKPIRYCGEKMVRCSYCKEHYSVCYVPVRKN